MNRPQPAHRSEASCGPLPGPMLASLPPQFLQGFSRHKDCSEIGAIALPLRCIPCCVAFLSGLVDFSLKFDKLGIE